MASKYYALSYIVWIAAYVAAVVLFVVMFQNYWAAVGFGMVIPLIFLRLFLFVAPVEKLYHVFPPLSWTRALFQGFFTALFLCFMCIVFFCIARGIQKHQAWRGDSYFCAMTGMVMAAKWTCFVMVPIHKLRPDLLSAETLSRIEANGDKVHFSYMDKSDEDEDEQQQERNEPVASEVYEGVSVKPLREVEKC